MILVTREKLELLEIKVIQAKQALLDQPETMGLMEQTDWMVPMVQQDLKEYRVKSDQLETMVPTELKAFRVTRNSRKRWC